MSLRSVPDLPGPVADAPAGVAARGGARPLPPGTLPIVWSLLAALIACSVAGAWHVPAVREEPLALAAAVALVACQACIGATVVLDRPVWSWRTAATVDVSAVPTVLAVWVSIEADVWPWTVAGVAHAVLWIAVAASVCPSPVREGRSA